MKKNRNEAKLALGSLTTNLGNKMFDVASNIFLAQLGAGSSFLTAIYQSSETLVGIVINLFAGALADSAKDKRRILILTDAICGFVCLFLAFTYASQFFVWAILATNILLAIFSTFNGPAAKSIIKFALRRERIGIYNGYMKSLKELIRVVSPFVTLTLMSFTNIRFIILFNAFTFFVSAFFEARLYIEKTEDAGNKAPSTQSIFKNIHDGFFYILQNKLIFSIVLLSAFVNFFLAGYNLFLPYTQYLLPHLGTNPYPIFISIESVGGILGAFLSMKNKVYTIQRMITYLFFVGLSILGMWISLGLGKIFLLTCFFVFTMNFFLTFFNIIFFTYIQQEVNEVYIGRVFSFVFTIAILFMPVGSFVFTGLFSIQTALAYLVIGAGLTFTCVLFYFLTHIQSKKV